MRLYFGINAGRPDGRVENSEQTSRLSSIQRYGSHDLLHRLLDGLRCWSVGLDM